MFSQRDEGRQREGRKQLYAEIFRFESTGTKRKRCLEDFKTPTFSSTRLLMSTADGSGQQFHYCVGIADAIAGKDPKSSVWWGMKYLDTFDGSTAFTKSDSDL